MQCVAAVSVARVSKKVEKTFENLQKTLDKMCDM